MLVIAALCAAPVIASYLAFYVWQPVGRINYGDLLELRPLPESRLSHLDGRRFRFADLRGKWLLLTLDSGACAKACEDRLFMMRQTRLMQGKDAERIERVFLITDETPLPTMLLREYDGTRMIRAGAIQDAFPASASRGGHIYLADPGGNLMLRFPQDPDPNRMKKDLERLLRAQGASPG
jgi:hypothetical protein